MSLKKISISLDSFVQKQTLHTSIERQFGSVQLNLLCVYSVGKLTLKTMLVCVWLVSSLIHMISACVLSDSEPIHITGFTGDSVVLPCACTDVQRKPESVEWTAYPRDQSTVIFSQNPPSVNDRYKHRVQVLDSISPGNLSLRLSDLTLSDGGPYRCKADGNHRDIRLTVKEGCVLSDSEPVHITGFTGDSVVLPCACTNVQRKPELVKWTVHPGGQSTVIFPQSPPGVNDRYKHRVQVFDSISPGNLSLRLSDLTLSDGGTYRCEADGQHRDISLALKDVPTQSPAITKHTSTRGSKPPPKTEISEDLKNSILYATIAVVAAVAVCGAVLFYCRVRSRKNAHVESREEQEMGTGEQEEEKNADSVTYSTVVYSIKVEKYKHPKSK
ncbi:uncharacterized protein LOC135260706 isoform X2 [Anguilla rostrata]|uniref:uncharacterized protein LOC135260706 isoform X2 n=1 Tax=Anguilla rostrata TaxID=7938 RepID=UPI0030CBD4B8